MGASWPSPRRRANAPGADQPTARRNLDTDKQPSVLSQFEFPVSGAQLPKIAGPVAG
jgi:hypothetical protein